MFKRILYLFMLFIAITSLALGVYKLFEYNNDSDEYDNHLMIEYSGAKQYAASSGNSSKKVLFFCSHSDNDCLYIENTLYPDISEQLESGNVEDVIDYVNIEDLIDSKTTSLLKNDWGISSYPAFIITVVEDNELKIADTLIWDPANPLNADDIIEWLNKNDIK